MLTSMHKENEVVAQITSASMTKELLNQCSFFFIAQTSFGKTLKKRVVIQWQMTVQKPKSI